VNVMLEFRVKRKFFMLPAAALLAGASLALADSAPTSGIQTADMDKSVRPQDDLFQYANGTWLKNVPIPADRSSYGVDSLMVERSLLLQRDLIEAAQTASEAEARKVSDLYSSYMNEARVERLGTKPLRGELDRVAVLRRADEVPVLMAHLDRLGIGSPLAGIRDRAAGPQALDAVCVFAQPGRSRAARPRLLSERRCAPLWISRQI
jgi:putative endopeptidase